MKLSKPTKSNSQHKVLRMIARNEQLERFDGKFVAMNRKYKDRSKYNRKDAKRELRRDLRGSYCFYTIPYYSYTIPIDASLQSRRGGEGSPLCWLRVRLMG